MIKLFRFNTFLLFILCVSLFLFCPVPSDAGNEKTVALVMKALSNPFFSRMEEGARKYAQEQNIPLEVFGVEKETDVEHQISIVESLISRGYGAIVIAPADSKRLVAVCKKALEKGIIIINIDNPLHKPTLNESGTSIPFVGSSNYIGARMIGSYAKSKLKGNGNVLIIEGIRGVENADLRKTGFSDAVTENSSIKVVSSESANWDTAEALSLTVKLLKDNDSIDAIFCANDAMALGALQAIEMLNLSQKIMIFGYDNIESVRTEIRSGRIQATVEQHPELMGEYGVALAWEGLNGKKIPLSKTTPLDLITYEHFNKKVALSVSTMSNTFFSILVKGAKEAANLFGMELIVLDANNQDAQQLTDLVKILPQKVDLLIVNPTNTELVFSGIELANNNAIPVITVDRKSSSGIVLCHIESDNVEGGRMAARILAQQMNRKGKVLELEGIPGTSAAYERGEGFNEELKRFEEIEIAYREVANFDRQEAKAVTLRILSKKKEIDGVFAHNDAMILGVIDAFEESGVKLPKALVGFDAIPEAKESIMQHKLTATVGQKPKRMGKLAVETAARYFRGENISPVKYVELSLIKK
ncbi:MAG: substrate-binding domain-containing protein [Deltaproteobacteria bacterium]|nr:substrate-binding domain-containing protein [Deltaproteobacteria bacterium]